MQHRSRLFIILYLILNRGAIATGCDSITSVSLPDVRIASASSELNPAAHCKVAGTIGREINFELLLPDEWNGKFVMGGGGGFVGQIDNQALFYRTSRSRLCDGRH